MSEPQVLYSISLKTTLQTQTLKPVSESCLVKKIPKLNPPFSAAQSDFALTPKPSLEIDITILLTPLLQMYYTFGQIRQFDQNREGCGIVNPCVS